MSGHSHFKTIKHKKGVTDAKRSKVFSKFSQEIALAAKEGGGDINFNPKLRIIVEKAKESNMPSENIERSIKRGTGEIEGGVIETLVVEAYGPGGIALIIEGITDNKNRTLGELKQILTERGGKLVSEGAVRWMFDRKGIIEIEIAQGLNKEELEMAVIESGAQDLYWTDEALEVYTAPEELETVRKNLEDKGHKPSSAVLGWAAKENIEISDADNESCQKLFEALDENDAVQGVYSNLK